jgi:hypothetical protein
MTVSFPMWAVYALVVWGVLNQVRFPDWLWVKFPTWLQVTFQVLRAVGVDGHKAFEKGKAIGQTISKVIPPTLPVLAFLLLSGCKGAEYPRHVARGTVLSVAYGVQLSDHLCAATAMALVEDGDVPPEPSASAKLPEASFAASFLEKPHFAFTSTAKDNRAKALALAEKCDEGYQAARAGLIGAGKMVDSWTDVEKRGEVVCGVLQGVDGLKGITKALELAGVVKLPSAVTDAFVAADAITAVVGASCKIR